MKTVEEAAKSAWAWVALVVGVCALSLGIVATAGYAKAEALAALRTDVTVLRSQRDGDDKWRAWMVEQIGSISVRMGVQVLPAPAPSSAPATIEQRK